MARACELVLLASVAVLLAGTATAFTTGSCIKEAEQLVQRLDKQPTLYSDISTEFKKLIKAVKGGYDVGEFYDSTLLLPTNQAMKAAKVNPTKIKNNEKLYRIHIFDGQLDVMAVGDVQLTKQPGVSVKVVKLAPRASPMKMGVHLAKSKNVVPVLAHLHTGTGNCFEAYGIGGVLS
ncbi:unnamed protein product [Closterium sp. Yama58-4]|nr:unnamed protein product [Closterium sp. Yama58-4]